jgi:putative transposase
MPRPRRSDLAGFPLHVIQRGNNRSACFLSDTDRAAYLHWLGRYAAMLKVDLHAWVLMGNHVHLLLTPPTPAHASKLMQALGRQYVPHVNAKYERTGTLWEGRFKACAVHAESYLIACMRYIELNPVRAGLAASPGDYRWSSFGRNALGFADCLVTEHPVYRGLGESPVDRQATYLELFRTQMDEISLARIRQATHSGRLITSERVGEDLAA